MIKLNRVAKPAFLSDEKVAELVAIYMENSKSVWNIEEIKNPLLSSSYGKCAYCECNLTQESKYMEVEHFEYKEHSPDKVVTWENLLPACKRCNGKKGMHNVLVEPIVNPYIEDPVNHFSINNYRLKGRTPEGKCTIEVVDLNNTERVVKMRFDLGNRIMELVDDANDKYQTYLANRNARAKNRFVRLIEGLLIECQPEAAYAATAATSLITNTDFLELIGKMRDEGLWGSEFENFYQRALLIVLPKP